MFAFVVGASSRRLCSSRGLAPVVAGACSSPPSFLSWSSLPVDAGAGQWAVGVGRGALSPGFGGCHDVGGLDLDSLLRDKIDVQDTLSQPHDGAYTGYAFWERRVHALLVLCVGKVCVSELKTPLVQNAAAAALSS